MSEKREFSKLIKDMTLIVASVFLGIALESMWQEKNDVDAAHASFGQMIKELTLDRVDAKRIIDGQVSNKKRYDDTMNLVRNYETSNNDSITKNLQFLMYSNLTLFPRRSAWTMMVDGGQITLIKDKALITVLGDLYANKYERIIYNGQQYDDDVSQILTFNGMQEWDFDNKELLVNSEESKKRLINNLKIMRNTWSDFYTNLIIEYRLQIDELIERSENYMIEEGYEHYLIK